MRIKISALTLLLFFALFLTVEGETMFPNPSYLQPMSGTNAYILSGSLASEIVAICGVDKNITIKHWQPSEPQVRVIDEKLNLRLNNVDSNTGLYNVIKIYFGIEDGKNKKFVYIFVFPASKDNGITLNFRDNSLVCPRLRSIAEFGLDKLELKMLKPDSSNTFNGWLTKKRNN
jgi:hypothetical protein